MPELAYPILAIAIGLAGLVWSADRFVDGSASIAYRLGIPPLLIGLTIVSFGTSAPEVLVSINATLNGAGDLAVGNALGSNLANMGMVLGITALMVKLPVQAHIVRYELPVLIAVTLLAGYALWDNHLNRGESQILIGLLIPALLYLLLGKKTELTSAERAAQQVLPSLPLGAAWLWLLIGIVTLIASAKSLVWGATNTAAYLGVSPLIIGLTVVALGTSLPELATTLVSAFKGHHDIALGNIIGSNIFNLLVVMAIPGLIYPLDLDAKVFTRDYVILALITGLLALFIIVTRSRNNAAPGLGKLAGLLLLTGYASYYFWLFHTETLR